MKVKTTEFLRLVIRDCGSLQAFCREFGTSIKMLLKQLKSDTFDYDETRKLLQMFSADDMKGVIDWEAMNVRCPI